MKHDHELAVRLYAPAAANNGGTRRADLAGLRPHDSKAERLLSRLDNVRQYGHGWRAGCPVHGGKSKSSLSIAIGDDGRILLHCFGGCAPLEIVHALGLELSDLFEKRITHCTTVAERRELRELARQSQWRAAIPALVIEALVIQIAGRMIDRGEPLSPEDDKRLTLAIERVTSTRMVFSGG